ncbi:hypothetical protein [Pedobacter psychroterrae]|uniref:RiboL-PSP-HEPN domain-containing protein n=1 Tax=Pedobacter psychroterrae TaxID=2530453 RepID=A0A4R0NL00_9SPHI|nr:hypothetical protein [Pedobacter psychroterrae]TCC99983.1 hypothetical protein EZ437_17240 [Pedobacter psychroterrae]
MSHQKHKINTILTILSNNPTLTTGRYPDIVEELKEALRVDRLNPTRRKNLMKVLHSMRALDSTLRAFLDYHGLRSDQHSIGDYIKRLYSHQGGALVGRLSAAEKETYLRNIADKRNKYLHSANRYPTGEMEVNDLIAEAHALIARMATF